MKEKIYCAWRFVLITGGYRPAVEIRSLADDTCVLSLDEKWVNVYGKGADMSVTFELIDVAREFLRECTEPSSYQCRCVPAEPKWEYVRRCSCVKIYKDGRLVDNVRWVDVYKDGVKFGCVTESEATDSLPDHAVRYARTLLRASAVN